MIVSMFEGPHQLHGARATRVDVFLNGVKVRYAMEADDDAGYVTFRVLKHPAQFVTVRGQVEITEVDRLGTLIYATSPDDNIAASES